LLNNGADAALQPTIIHKAVYSNSNPRGFQLEQFSELIQNLVAKGANPNGLWEGDLGGGPDARSIWSGSPGQGGNDPLGPVTPIFWTLSAKCRSQHCVEILQVLVDNGADPKIRNAQGKSGLFEAVQVVYMYGVENIPIVEFFVTMGCDPQEVGPINMIP